jgi:transposase-like protein
VEVSDATTSKPEALVSHANARLTVHGRALLVRRVLVDRRPIAHVAKELGISRQCAHRWVARFGAEGMAGLRDRSSRPRRCPSRTSAAVEALVLAVRTERRCGPAGIAEQTGVPARTISRILGRHGVPRLAECDPLTGQLIRASKSTAHRYEHPVPGAR